MEQNEQTEHSNENEIESEGTIFAVYYFGYFFPFMFLQIYVE